MTSYEYAIECRTAKDKPWQLYNAGTNAAPFTRDDVEPMLAHYTSEHSEGTTEFRIVRRPTAWAPVDVPAGTRDDPWQNAQIGVENYAMHLVSLTLRNGDSPDPRDPETLTVLLGPDEALSVAQQIIVQASGQYATALDSALRGDCPTCQNLRMVTVTKHGHDTQEHCPDCTARPPESAMVFGRRPPPPLPTLPYVAELERKVMGR